MPRRLVFLLTVLLTLPQSTRISETAFALPALSGQITEDLDYDPALTKQFFLTTVIGRKIFAVTPDGQLREFATSPDGWPLLAIKIDPIRRELWATAVALRDFAGVPESTQGKSAILCYALPSGKLLRRIAVPFDAAFGDFALTTEGDLILADNQGGGVYELARGTANLSRLDHGEFRSPQTPALAGDNHVLFIPDYSKGIARLSRTTRKLSWLDPQNKFSLQGIDGLYFYRGTLIAVQNGSTPERVVQFTLDPDLTRIIGETIIEQSTSTLGDPTHGVIVGHTFYYIANSGWDQVDDHGAPRPHLKPTAPRLMRFTLP